MDEPTKEHLRSIHEAFGLALTAWTAVELNCYRLYIGFMHGAELAMISASWHNIQSFDAKILLLDRCAKIAFDSDSYQAEWKPLHKRLKDSSLIRNSIVHSILVSRIESDNSISTFYSNSIFDVTADIRGRLNNPRYEFPEGKLIDISEDFSDIASNVKTMTLARYPHAEIDRTY